MSPASAEPFRAEPIRAEPRSSPSPDEARVALVTGAARRIGRAIALGLADAGWDIGLHFHSSHADAQQTADEIRQRGRRVHLLPADLNDEARVSSLIPELQEALGPVSVLVNSASRFDFDRADDFSYQSLQQHMLPNVAAPVLLSRQLARHLADRFPVQAPPQYTTTVVPGDHDAEPGVIINLLDQKLYNLNPDFLSYTMSKAALAAATTMLAQALAPRVRVVGIAPGLTLPSYLQDQKHFERTHQKTSPLGRSSSVDDLVQTALFIVRNRALTGTVIVADGGQHLLGLPRDVSFIR